MRAFLTHPRFRALVVMAFLWTLSVCLLGSVGVLCVVRAVGEARRTACAGNLATLWKLHHIRLSQYGSRRRLMPAETGREFWLLLAQGHRPLLDPEHFDVLQCPVKRPGAWGDVDYFGPPSPVARVANDAPVGSDRPDNHRDGLNVLLKTGDIVRFSPDEWAALPEAERCVP